LVTRTSFIIPFNICNNLPVISAARRKEQQKQMQALVMTIIKEENQNLTPAQKELLQWHFCLGHVSFG